MTTRRGAPSIRYWLPLVVWIVAILAVSSIPGPTLAKVGFSVQDKVAHASEYCVLGFLLCRWLLGVAVPPARALPLAVAMGAGMGAADESWQRLIPGRETAMADWRADVLGVLIGVTVASVYYLLAIRGSRAAAAVPTTSPGGARRADGGEES